MKFLKLALFTSILLPSLAFAHAGGKDSNGGHTDKKTGIYHCHDSTCVVPVTKKTLESKPPTRKTLENKIKYPMPTRVLAKHGKYVRKEWKHWSDFDGDCQDARAETLITASVSPVKFKTGRNCEVVSGKFYDPFTNKHYTSDNSIDIDHIIPLKEAHEAGGYAFSPKMKEQFANDPDNLLAVYLGQNRSKGDRHPLIWMPENKAYHCEYLARWIFVKQKYGLFLRTAVKNKYIKECT